MEHEGFIEELDDIRQAEGEKGRIIGKGRREAEKIGSEANSEAKKIVEKAMAESEKIGDEILAKARGEIEEKERKIISKAEKETAEIASMSIPAAVIRKAVDGIDEGQN